ncbi:hypothetical protein Dimus_038825 [Dionaea muscipula]
MFKLRTLPETFQQAKLQEMVIDSLARRSKPTFTPKPTATTNPTPATRQNTNQNTNSYQPKPNTTPNPSYSDLRVQGRCFKCKEKYTPGYHCNPKLLNMEGDGSEHGDEMKVEEEEEVYEDACGDGQGENPEDEELPTQTLSSLTPQHALKVRCMTGGRELIILADSGATSSFIDATVVQEVECSVMDTNPLRVAIANGESMTSHAKCPNFS